MNALIHFAAHTVTSVWSVPQPGRAMKPSGLWVSVEGEDSYGWSNWCRDEDFCTERLAVAHNVVLEPNANVLHIGTVTGIDDFTTRYALDRYYIAWSRVEADYQGIIIDPYQWGRRLTPHSSWYYGWDCASGCIWDAAAVASIAACSLVEVGTP